MKTSLKIATTALVLFIALGAVAYVYACSQNSLTANTDLTQTGIQNMPFYASDNVNSPDNATMPWGHMRRMPEMRENNLQFPLRLLQNATLTTVNGTVVSTVQGMLILNTDTSQVRILLPKDWTVGSEIVDRATLFNGTFASPGQSVTVEVLESNIFSNTSFTINIMMGYEVTNATNAQAHAVLPFNIQPTS